jgi:hypothetical protein
MKRALITLFIGIFSMAAPATLINASESDANSVIARYVAMHKKWKTSQYRIQRHGREGAHDVYWVIWIADEKLPYPGGGKSIEVLYDSKAHQVIREFRFQ